MKILLCVGHCIRKNGACSSADGTAKGGVNEYAYNKELIEYVAAPLRADGHEVDVLIAPEKTLATMAAERDYFISKEHAKKYDLSVQLHLNCYNGKAKGCEAWSYTGSSKGRLIAERVSAKLGTVWTNRGAKTSQELYWLKHTRATAVLVESFFCDNSKDYAKAVKLGLKKHGLLIASGLIGKDLTA